MCDGSSTCYRSPLLPSDRWAYSYFIHKLFYYSFTSFLDHNRGAVGHHEVKSHALIGFLHSHGEVWVPSCWSLLLDLGCEALEDLR